MRAADLGLSRFILTWLAHHVVKGPGRTPVGDMRHEGAQRFLYSSISRCWMVPVPEEA